MIIKLVVINEKKELIWFLNHDHIYTMGTSSNKKESQNKIDIPLIKTNRGGKINLHNPSKKIIYFALNLNKRGKDVRKLVSKIETCIMEILKEYEIKSCTDKKNIGIWVKKKDNLMKIAAIGIRVRKWIAYHGFAINVSNDLSKYKNIVPCGVKDKGITSLKEIGVNNLDKIEEIIAKKFLDIFL